MKATLVFSDDYDWEGLYLDNKLVQQGHRIDPYDMLVFWHKTGAILDERESVEVSGDWLEAWGALPATLEEFEKINGTNYE